MMRSCCFPGHPWVAPPTVRGPVGWIALCVRPSARPPNTILLLTNSPTFPLPLCQNRRHHEHQGFLLPWRPYVRSIVASDVPPCFFRALAPASFPLSRRRHLRDAPDFGFPAPVWGTLRCVLLLLRSLLFLLLHFHLTHLCPSTFHAPSLPCHRIEPWLLDFAT